MSTDVFFRVSSGLKNILGRDLITNDFVAVFELVKNGFDAHAKNVWLIFREDRIFVVDDGKGMTDEDMRDKWLFVAYSAKEEGTEDNLCGSASKCAAVSAILLPRFPAMWPASRRRDRACLS